MAVALKEILIGVREIDASERVFSEGLGLACVSRRTPAADDEHETICLGREDLPGSTVIRLLLRTGAASRPPGRSRSIGGLGVGFTTSDIVRVHTRLEHLGVRFLSPPLEISPAPVDEAGPRRFEAFGQTRDGDFTVLVERRSAPGPYGDIHPLSLVSEPLHTSHVVRDLEACRHFMEEVLDHRVLFTETCQGLIFERLMALPSGASFDFQMLAHPEQATGRIIFIEMEGGLDDAAGEEVASRRGLLALTYSCDALDRRVAAATTAGATIVQPPEEVPDHPLGPGRRAVLAPPFDVHLELHQATAGVSRCKPID